MFWPLFFCPLIFWPQFLWRGGGQKILKIIYESLILQIYNRARNRKAIFWLLPAMLKKFRDFRWWKSVKGQISFKSYNFFFLRAVVLLPPLFGRHIGFILNFFVVYPVVLFKFSQKSKSTESFPEKKEILNHFKVIFIRPLRLLFSPPGIFCCKYKVFENYMWNIQSFKFNGFVKLFFHLLLAIFVNVFW